MTENLQAWNYLERRADSSYQQLCIKGKRIWAWTLYCEVMNAKEPVQRKHLPRTSIIPWKRSDRPLRIARATPRKSERITVRTSCGPRRPA